MRLISLSVLALSLSACGDAEHQIADPIEETGGVVGSGGAEAGGAATGGAAVTGGAGAGGSSAGSGGAGGSALRACRPPNVAAAIEGCERTGPCTSAADCHSSRTDMCVAGQCVAPCRPVDMGIPCDGLRCAWHVGGNALAKPSAAECSDPSGGYFCSTTLADAPALCAPFTNPAQ